MLKAKPTRKKLKLFTGLIAALFVGGIALNALRPMPSGTQIKTDLQSTAQAEFLYDLTYQKNGKTVHDQQIFERVKQEIDKAHDFIIIDMFLFNSDYDRKSSYPPLSGQLAQSLLDKAQADPDIKIFVITDEINDFYGSYNTTSLEMLRREGIPVILTDLNKLRDSNPAWSVLWRSCMQWFGTEGNGRLPNPFSHDAPKVTLRSYLKMFNFKANHRKVLATENCAIVQSANPHDASGYHSNTAILVSGGIQQDIIDSERQVAAFSGLEIPELTAKSKQNNNITAGSVPPQIADGNKTGSLAAQAKQPYSEPVQAEYLSEGMIKQTLLQSIDSTRNNESIDIGMFYLSEREIIKSLLKASERGVKIRLILDANKDAFGRKKNGIPNRCVADELLAKSDNKIQIRWYDTHGEQFHAKFVMLHHKNSFELFTGSCNLTRRNLDNYNLESDIRLVTQANSDIASQASAYYERLWNNEDGSYTVSYEALGPKGTAAYLIYRLQDWSGLCTF